MPAPSSDHPERTTEKTVLQPLSNAGHWLMQLSFQRLNSFGHVMYPGLHQLNAMGQLSREHLVSLATVLYGRTLSPMLAGNSMRYEILADFPSPHGTLALVFFPDAKTET